MKGLVHGGDLYGYTSPPIDFSVNTNPLGLPASVRQALFHASECWERYPDTTVFMTDCRIVKNHQIQRRNMVWLVKRLLRLPLRFYRLSDVSWVKKAALIFGNPVICPSCTYHKGRLGTPLFRSPFKFALDWDTLWRLAGEPGRFLCVERPLMYYRIHDGATTKACIENRQRTEDEAAMYAKIWPEPVVGLLMHFYQKAYKAYDSGNEG